MKLELTKEEMIQTLNALAEQPFHKVVMLIQKIEKQFKEQEKEV